jgi:ATP synthase protein I
LFSRSQALFDTAVEPSRDRSPAMKLNPTKLLVRPLKDKPLAGSSSDRSHDGVGRGIEMAALVLLFFGIGYGLDRWFDTKPVFMIIFVVLAIVGQFASLYYGYNERMKALEERREAMRRGGSKLR